ncbi:hypothetical protein TPB0596_10190 [Tsukamurella pulmonis]|nr:hypothetical protein TPB0596_10190 [Tsukamurella pulmonis]
MPRVAERLNEWFAFAAVADANGRRREPSTAEVAEAISADASHGVSISRTYLAGLRNGGQRNPTISVVEALVAYFRPRLAESGIDVSANALLGDTAQPPAAVGAMSAEWERLMASGRVRSIAMRAGAMSPQMQEQVLRMLDVLAPESGNGNDEHARRSEAGD